jgi:hypothetical protein
MSSSSSTTNANSDGQIDTEVPVIQVTVQRRPRYCVDIDETLHYCQNAESVIGLLKQHGREISLGDVFKSLDMKPRHKYRLRERLNGAIIRKIPRL